MSTDRQLPHTDQSEPRPYERETMMRRDNAEFTRGITMLVVFPLLVPLTWIETPDSARTWFVVAIAAIVLANVIGSLVRWDRLPRFVESSMPLSTVAAAWLWASSAGGFGNGFSILAMPPLLWLATYADPPDVAAGLLLLSALALSPAHSMFSGLPDPGSTIATIVSLLLIVLVTMMILPLVAMLRRRNRELEHATRSLRVAQAALAHDLRTPMTSAIALATMASERIDEGTEPDLRAAREYADRIVDIGWRAESTIAGALELSLAGERLPFATEVDPVVLLEAAAAEAGDVQLSFGPMPAAVVGHAPSLQRAFENVLRNAVDHAHPHRAGRTVRVHVECETAPRSWRIHLSDDGRGLPNQGRAQLLEPWQRGSGSGDDARGLGLAIVAAIAERHGGSVELGDGPDGGARITIEIAREPQVQELAQA